MTVSTTGAARFFLIRSLWLGLVWIILSGLPGPAIAAQGQWTALQPLGGEAIHMALIPDPDATFPNRHSRLIWWQSRTVGNVLRWPRPSVEDCASFPILPALGWNPGEDIFCGGHVPLDGKLFTAGGNDEKKWGLSDARIYDPTTGLWSQRPAMRDARWYPSATVLRDGRVMVAAGNKGEQLWFFGGRRDGSIPTSPVADSVFRFGRMKGTQSGGYWDLSVRPLPDGNESPVPREGHTAALLVDPFDPSVNAQAIFGGKDGAGVPVDNQLWFLRRETGGTFDADYTYRWIKQATQGTPPAGRSEHTAIVRSQTEMFVFGGVKRVAGVDTPTNEVWRLYKDTFGVWNWTQVFPTGNPPSARWGHAAVYQPPPRDRMLVFWGAESAPGASCMLADSRVWSLEFATNTWSELPLLASTFGPGPRRNHAMVSDPESGAPVLYGGDLCGGGTSDTLWLLDTTAQPAQWIHLQTTGTSAGARAGHTAVFDPTFAFARRRLFIFGGEQVPGGPVPDKTVHMVEPFNFPRPWYAWGEAPFSLSGHAATLDTYGLMYARTPEIYDPTSNAWTQSPGSGLYQSYYPLDFIVPGNPSGGGRVVSAGADPQARYLDIPASGPAGAWQSVGIGGSGNSGFQATSGVMYEPGRIMIAGGIDLAGAAVVGTSKTLDARSVSNGWMATGSPAMAPRYRHNLVLLPTGQVLVVGGVTELPITSLAAVHCPQLWSPSSGSWTLEGDLACDLDGSTPVVRNYHSTALLLPDARVISAGGSDPNPYRTQARILCPPYLFKPNVTPDEFAPRPAITSAPTNLTWGQVFTICTPNPAAVQKVSLVRSGSTTHSFDENQRYVELTKLGSASNPSRLFVAAPATRDDTPPGDYLLFLVGSSDGSGTYPDAPSIAEWVRLQGPAGADLCDTTLPGTILVGPEVVDEHNILLTWEASADDGILAASGVEKRFDLRVSGSAINSEYRWSIAAQVTNEPDPGPVGTTHELPLPGLNPCTTYHFSLRAEDDHPNLGALPPDIWVQTPGSGCGGGTTSARPVDGRVEGGGTAPVAGGSTGVGIGSATGPRSAGGAELAASSSLQSPGAPLVIETRRLEGGGWQVSLRLATESDGLDPAASSITVERERADGGHEVLGEFTPSQSENILGLCALRERGRLAIPGFTSVEGVMARVRRDGQDYALTEAHHSRLGPLGAEFIAVGGSVELLAGDVIDLSYAPTGEESQNTPSWYVLARRLGSAPPTPFARRRTLGDQLPERFALYPSEPNPAESATLIRFDLPAESPVKLEVFDLLGRRVATLADGMFPAGRHGAAWNMRDSGGATVRPGVYVYRLTAGEYRAKGKMSVLP